MATSRPQSQLALQLLLPLLLLLLGGGGVTNVVDAKGARGTGGGSTGGSTGGSGWTSTPSNSGESDGDSSDSRTVMIAVIVVLGVFFLGIAIACVICVIRDRGQSRDSDQYESGKQLSSQHKHNTKLEKEKLEQDYANQLRLIRNQYGGGSGAAAAAETTKAATEPDAHVPPMTNGAEDGTSFVDNFMAGTKPSSQPDRKDEDSITVETMSEVIDPTPIPPSGKWEGSYYQKGVKVPSMYEFHFQHASTSSPLSDEEQPMAFPSTTTGSAGGTLSGLTKDRDGQADMYGYFFYDPTTKKTRVIWIEYYTRRTDDLTTYCLGTIEDHDETPRMKGTYKSSTGIGGRFECSACSAPTPEP